MTPSTLTRASKFMSLVLRHQPGLIGLTLNAGGWASLDELIACSQASRTPLSRELILSVVRENDKQRFRLSEDGLWIRASQGHSIAVDLALPSLEPPLQLFHGTATRFLQAIQREGLKPRSRQHVHLSPDRDTAVRVGQRHGKPIVLVIDAHRLWETGQLFYRSDNGVWLTQQVPPAFIDFNSVDTAD